ncbi:MAG: hypothetical protein LAO06_01085 [Acidobacteriia bacterium]|nr:hypothetical protein [Terriglobia bacterium]
MQVQRTLAAEPTNGSFERGVVQVSRYVTLPIIVTLIICATGTGRGTLLQIVLSYLLLQFGWGYWVHWKQKPDGDKDFPLFAAIAGVYWLAYGMPVFWNLQNAWTFRHTRPLTEAGVNRSLVLALVALASLFVGMHLGIFRRLRHAAMPDLRDARISPKYVAVVMLLGPFLANSSMTYILGSGFRQLLMILRGIVPLAAFAILLRRRLMRPVPPFERVALIIFVALTIGMGMASGWIGTGARVMIIAGSVLVDTRFKIPKGALVLVFAFAIFLQPVKEQFRNRYWGAEELTSQTHRASDWFTTALHRWEATLSDSNPAAFSDTLYSSVARFSLLQQTANVMEVTPGIIPYQGSFMYKYMAVTVIPRALWPDKPTVNEANRFYQVTYGLTAERDLDGVSISVGVAAESYIAYGWFGTVGIMMLIGVVLDGIATVCLARNSSVLMKGIGLTLLPSLVGIEAQMAQYLGGLLQQAFVTIAVMLPIVQVRRRAPSFSRVLRRPMRVSDTPRHVLGAVRAPQTIR